MNRGQRAPQRGPQLPYRTLGSVIATTASWVLVPGRLQGTSMGPQPPQRFATLQEILDYKPTFEILTIQIPVGLLDEPAAGGRACERDARRLLGRNRGAAVRSAPARKALTARSFAEAKERNEGMGLITYQLLGRIAEADASVAPYIQRSVYETHAELSFFNMNGDAPLKHPKRTPEGREERVQLLTARIPGVERVLNAQLHRTTVAHLIDASAGLWTARRIAARAAARLPEVPEWDSTGLRMELYR